jgi:hypothetical protein
VGRCVGAWVRGCVGAWVRECVGAWVRECVGAWVRKWYESGQSCHSEGGAARRSPCAWKAWRRPKNLYAGRQDLSRGPSLPGRCPGKGFRARARRFFGTSHPGFTRSRGGEQRAAEKCKELLLPFSASPRPPRLRVTHKQGPNAHGSPRIGVTGVSPDVAIRKPGPALSGPMTKPRRGRIRGGARHPPSRPATWCARWSGTPTRAAAARRRCGR